MIALAWISAALAGAVYVNGVRADVLPEMTLENVTVRIDAQGNLYIDAPGYRVGVVSPPASVPAAPAAAAPAPVYPAAPAYPVPPVTGYPLPGSPPTAPSAPPSSGGPYGSTAPAAPVPAAPPASAAVAPSASVVPVGTWWLVTEDNDSTGHTVDVLVNGVLAKRIRSGDPQLILDLGPYLKPGANEIAMMAQPSPALGGGVLNLFVGRGTNASGTIRMDDPSIRYARRATDLPAGATGTFTLVVP